MTALSLSLHSNCCVHMQNKKDEKGGHLQVLFKTISMPPFTFLSANHDKKHGWAHAPTPPTPYFQESLSRQIFISLFLGQAHSCNSLSCYNSKVKNEHLECHFQCQQQTKPHPQTLL